MNNPTLLRVLMIEPDRTRTAHVRRALRQAGLKVRMRTEYVESGIRRCLRSGEFDIAFSFQPLSRESLIARGEFSAQIPFFVIENEHSETHSALSLDDPSRWAGLIEAARDAIAPQNGNGNHHNGKSHSTPQISAPASQSTADSDERLNRERVMLLALAKTVNSQHDLNDIARSIAGHLRPFIPFDLLFVSLFEGEQLRLASSDGSPATPLDDAIPQVISGNDGFWAMMDKRETFVDNDFLAPPSEAQPTFGLSEHSTRAYINAPLLIDGGVIGVLHLDAFRPHVFSDDHVRLAALAAEQVAVAVRQINLLRGARAAEMRALEAAKRLRDLVNQVDAIVWEADPLRETFTYVSPRVQTLLGYSGEEWLTTFDDWSRRLHPDDRERVLEECRVATLSGLDHVLEFRMMSSDGRFIWLRDLVSVETENGVSTQMHGVMFDISAQREIEERMLEANAILQATQESSADGMFLVDETGHVRSCNRRFAEMWQIEPSVIDELRSKQQLMFTILSLMEEPDEFLDQISYLIDHPDASTRDEVTLADGRVFERFSSPALSPDGHSYGRVWSFSDITERKQSERRLKHQAWHDPLTTLPNRALFMENLIRALARARRSGELTAVLFLDLDRFKIVNDSLGHETGDLLLIEASNRLKECLRPGDLAARFGGDEFTVLIENIDDISDATGVAGRIADALSSPFDLRGHEITTTASIGIVFSQAGGDRAEDLLRDADVAMYRAKTRGRARYEVFDAAMSAQTFERLTLEIELRQSVKRDQLRLFYQPFIDLKSGRICGAEALVRWQHPTRGLILPTEFVTMAEESGLIHPLGHWVLDAACRQAQMWQARYFAASPFMMSVNLSPRQFLQPGLSGEVARALHESCLPPHILNLEITERALLEAGQLTGGILSALRELGALLSIDDFGTGYSSLSYLRQFSLDALKVDRSFVEGAVSDKQDRAIVQAVHSLAQAMGMKVIAEGIETSEQLHQLRGLGCDVGQGYFFSNPISAAEFEHLLESDASW